jgi:hexokinase
MPFDLRLLQPAPVTLSLTEVRFGPAEFQLLGTHFSEFELDRAEGLWHTTGRFDGLHPQALDAQARAPRRVVRTAGDRAADALIAGISACATATGCRDRAHRGRSYGISAQPDRYQRRRRRTQHPFEPRDRRHVRGRALGSTMRRSMRSSTDVFGRSY